MSTRSAAVVELENQLREMLGPSGGLMETRWVGRLVDLMKETENIEGRIFLIKVLLNTPQTEKATLTRFIQLGGVEILGKWINEHKNTNDTEDRQAVQSILSSLNKLTITKEVLQRTEIGKIVNSLKKSGDPSIQAKASSIVSKWEKMIRDSMEDQQPSIRPPPRPKENKHLIPAKKEDLERPKLEDRPLYEPVPDTEPIQPRTKALRWADEDHISKVKYFWRSDEPNAQCASKRPPPTVLDSILPESTSSVEDFRRWETQMERELNRKVNPIQAREKGDSIRHQLDNMTPRIFYSTLYSKLYSELIIHKTERKPAESREQQEEQAREQNVLRVSFHRESDVPFAPQDAPGAVTELNGDVVLIPSNTNVETPSAAPPDAFAIGSEALSENGEPNIPMPMVPGPVPMNEPAMYPNMMEFMMMGMGNRVPMYNPAIIMNPNTRPINFRTEACKNYHSTAGCTHGDNCHFIHDFEYEGRPIPNMTEWRRTNETRIKNLEAMRNMQIGMGSYMPQGPGIEPHNK